MESLTTKQENRVITEDDCFPLPFPQKEIPKTEEIETGDYLIDEDESYYSKQPNMDLPRPVEGLNEAGPTPFLKKTYRMVEDPETNEIISWSGSKKSFIVWDHHRFSTNLLPMHFKHNNFSSFIRQLNTYGFKKIDPDRWEFAHEGFQEEQKHLLKTIKRRKQTPQTNCGIEAEVEKLSDDRNKLKTEISKLKHEQETTQGYLDAIRNKIEINEYKQQQMFVFMAKAFSNPNFLGKFIQVLRQKRGICGTHIAKKPRLIRPISQKHEEVATVEPEVKMLFSPSMDGEGSSPSEGQKGNSTSSSPDLETENCISLGKFWEGELLLENEIQGEGDFVQNQSNFELELENLIAKPSEHWSNYMRDMVDQVADVI